MLAARNEVEGLELGLDGCSELVCVGYSEPQLMGHHNLCPTA